MSGSRIFKLANFILAVLIVAILLPNAAKARIEARGDLQPTTFETEKGDSKSKEKKKKKKKKGNKKKKKKKKIRWGKRRKESNKAYDKRFARVLKRTKQDKPGDHEGGKFVDGEGNEIQLWTYMGHPFIVRSDISKEFTAHTVMYMEMLHREFGAAMGKILTKPANVKEPVEILVFADRATYMQAGGGANSGGQFVTFFGKPQGRGPGWKAQHYRMSQFTEGITDFAKWPKGVLKHESAHMELAMRLGFKKNPQANGVEPISTPIWFNEGQASVFESWDFRKTVDENIAELATRGRYAPCVRRMYGTASWKDFDYYWTMDRKKWGSEGPEQVFLNYCQAWSLIGYMFTGGVNGKRDFRRIYDLSKRVGTNDVAGGKAWEEKFPADQREEMKKNWNKWVQENIPKEGRITDERFLLLENGYVPEVTDRLERITKENAKEYAEWLKKEEKRRRKGKKIEW